MKDKVRIAIIDSGIDSNINNLGENIKLSLCFGISEDGYITELGDEPVEHMHGTAIASVIKYINPDIEIINFKIFDEILSTDTRVLLYAASRVFDYQPDIINMSLGTFNCSYLDDFQKIIQEAERQNVILVAAADNTGNISYPAYLDGVIGVKADASLKAEQYYFKDDFFYASADIKIIPEAKRINKNKIMAGNSIAAAYITGYISKIYSKLNNSLSRENAIKNLICMSKKGVSIND